MAKTEKIYSQIITEWYKIHQRELPWRETQNPYLIWISEIILQQTRVAQGYEYYLRFVERFPDIRTLAEAPEDDVLKHWEGLGYYSRARNLHEAARMIVNRFDGHFPEQYIDILSLKGVGGYTAAAIASFAFGLPYAVLDGNVFRVLARLFAVKEAIDSGTGKKFFSELAREILDAGNPALHNQAIMEFGALQCVPVNPDCQACPLQVHCLAYEQGLVAQLPYKKGKTKVSNRYFNYFDIRQGNQFLIRKRDKEDIWKNLYELPLIETTTEMEIEELLHSKALEQLVPDVSSVKIAAIPKLFKHVLSHRVIYARFYQVEVQNIHSFDGEYLLVDETVAEKLAFSRLVNRYLESR